jgi:hypothetical protein
MKRQSLMLWVALLVLTGVFSFAPVSHASPANNPVSGNGVIVNSDPINCTNGCTIITCGKITCTVWYCNASGCTVKGSYGNPGNVVRNDSLERSGLPTVPERDDLAFAKMCSGNTCQLYELTPDKAIKVGYVDNIDEIIKELRAKHAAGEG